MSEIGLFRWDTLCHSKESISYERQQNDQIRSLCVQKTYITISEWISYYIDWKMAFVCLLYQPSAPKLRVYCNIIQAILSMKFQNIPMNNTFLSELMTWAIIKNVKSISRVNHIDSLYMKWCTLKNMGNWPFSPGHTLSHKTNNILRTTVDMTKIKTNVCKYSPPPPPPPPHTHTHTQHKTEQQ